VDEVRRPPLIAVSALRRQLSFFAQRPGAHRALHSFPTRRSSDLPCDNHRHRHGSTPEIRHSKQIFDLIDHRRYRLAALHFSCGRSEEHTSELQSRENLVCRLLLEKKKKPTSCPHPARYAPTPSPA